MRGWWVTLVVAGCAGGRAPAQPPHSAARVMVPAPAPTARCGRTPLPAWAAAAPRRLSPDGKTLLAADGSNVVFVDTTTWKARATLKRTGAAVAWLDTSPDGRVLLVASDPKHVQGTVQLYDTASLKMLAYAKSVELDDGAPILSFAPDSSWFAYAEMVPSTNPAFEGPMAVVEIQGLHPAGTRVVIRPKLSRYQEPPRYVSSLDVAPDGKSLVIDGMHTTVLVRAPSGERLFEQPSKSGHPPWSYSRSGRYLGIWKEDRGTVIVDVPTGSRRELVSPLCNGIEAPAFNHDESLVAVGGTAYLACTFETKTGQLDDRFSLRQPEDGKDTANRLVRIIGWTPDDRGLLAVNAAQDMQLWNVAKHDLVDMPGSEGRHFYVWRSDGSIITMPGFAAPDYSIESGPRAVRLPKQPADVTHWAGRSHDAEWVALAGDGVVDIVSTRDGKLRTRIDTHSRSLVFGTHDRFVFTSRKQLRVWSAKTGQQLFPPTCD